MDKLFGFKIGLSDCPVGEYYKSGVLNKMLFGEYIFMVSKGEPLPNTFKKYFKNKGFVVYDKTIYPQMNT